MKKCKKSNIKTINLKHQPYKKDKFELPDRLYSISDIQDCFEYIIKTHETLTDNPAIKINVNRIENRTTFKN